MLTRKFLPFVILLVLVACQPLAPVGITYLLNNGNPASATPAPIPPLTPTATPLPRLPRFTPTPRPLPLWTETPSPSPTPAWTLQGPGEVTVPILLYHHIESSDFPSRYRVPPEKFEQQLQLLREWGYTTITTELLVQAITTGAELPPRPIIITFDDGDVDVYENAFPLMEKYGFKGVFYLVGHYIGQPDYITVEQVQEMAAAGWEIGSHSLNHLDLTKNRDQQRAEIVESKEQLEAMLGVPVQTFAYPFGRSGKAIVDYARFAGYIAGMGLGYSSVQSERNLFYLWRWEVQGGFDLKALADYLPWKGDLTILSTAQAASQPTSTSLP